MKIPYVILIHSFIFTVVLTGSSAIQLESTNINQNDIIFYLYTRNNPLAPVQLYQDTLKSVDAQKQTKFIIHGFFESAEKLWYKNMTNEFLKKGDYNVIQVDWSKPASDTYATSSRNTKDVGTIVGRLIANLHRNYGLSLDNVHVIGHSLGAHVSGYTGKEVIKQTGSPIFRITALDAAGPLFEGPVVLMQGITSKDARVVDAIHTDGGIFGRREAIGTVDFYPNRGAAPQPGCSIYVIPIPPRSYVEMAQEVFCSHTKSHQYFISSINNENFQAIKCDSWDDFEKGRCDTNIVAMMGDDYSYTPETTGMFFLKTNSQPPYARNLK